MSQQSQPTQTGVQSRQTTGNGQQALQQAIEYPMRQAVQFQRSAARIFLNGLEMQDWAQQQGIQMSKTLLDSYLRTVERAGEGAARIPQEIAEQAQEGMQEGQSMAQQSLQADEQMTQGFQPTRRTEGGQQQPTQPPQGARFQQRAQPSQQGAQPSQQRTQQPQGIGAPQQIIDPRQQQAPPQPASGQPTQGQPTQDQPAHGQQVPVETPEDKRAAQGGQRARENERHVAEPTQE